jgi:hypothetical protein
LFESSKEELRLVVSSCENLGKSLLFQIYITSVQGFTAKAAGERPNRQQEGDPQAQV